MKIWGVITLLGFVLILGPVGAADLNTISFGRMVMQSLIGLALMCVGFRGAAIENRRK